MGLTAARAEAIAMVGYTSLFNWDTTFVSLRQDPAHPAAEMLRVDRLDHPARHALAAVGLKLTGMTAREHEHGEEAMGGQLPHRGDQRKTVEIRHLQIGDQQITGFLLKHVQSCLTVGNRDDLEIEVAELFGHPAPDRSAIVGMYDGLGHTITQALATQGTV